MGLSGRKRAPPLVPEARNPPKPLQPVTTAAIMNIFQEKRSTHNANYRPLRAVPNGRIHLGNIFLLPSGMGLSARQKGDGAVLRVRTWIPPAAPGSMRYSCRRTCAGWALTGTGA